MSEPKFFDSHCHLQFAAYRGEALKVAKETLDQGVWFVTVGTQGDTSKAAVALAEEFPEGAYAAIGLHPNHLYEMQFDEDKMAIKTRAERFDAPRYAELAKSSKVVAVGECGLDLHHLPEGVPEREVLKTQIEEFEKQIEFADAQNLPLIIHCRDAQEELLDVLENAVRGGAAKRRGVIHSYTGTWPNAEKYLALGFHIGFNGIITFPPRKNAPEEHAALLNGAKSVPDEFLLIETDAPYLAPVPNRGERNRPDYVSHVAAKLAELRGTDPETIAALTANNAKKLFLSKKIA